MKAVLNFDGESSPRKKDRAHANFYIVLENNSIETGTKELAPDSTNNYAEYFGLIYGLERALELGVTVISIRGDSQLIVNQVTGRYRVKKDTLQVLHKMVHELLSRFESWSIEWIPREENTDADGLSRKM